MGGSEAPPHPPTSRSPWSGRSSSTTIEHVFDSAPVLTAEEYEDYLIACHETEFADDYPDAALFVRDEQQRFLDSRARLLNSGAVHLDGAVAAAEQLSRDEA